MRKLLAVVTVIGCGLAGPVSAGAQAAKSSKQAPTFSKDVAPIFYKSCTSCHRPGEIAPVSLLTYSTARPYARAIATQVARGTMPPWHADPAHGVFANDRRLSASEKDTILQWVSAGAPEGNRADLPAPPAYPSGWSIEPDAVLALGEDYPIPASGTIEYKYFPVPTNFTEDKWVQAFEVRPGTPSAVHHVIVFARPPRPAQTAGQPPARPQQRGGAPFTFGAGMEEPKNQAVEAAKRAPNNDRPAPEGGLGSFVGAFVPGHGVRIFDDGTALRVRAGSTLVFQIHYTANGKAATDRTKIGFTFAKTPPKSELIIASLQNANFTIPAGEAAARVDAEMTLLTDLTVWSLLPHTHVRGRRWEVQAIYPDGRSELVLTVPTYDFNWQTDYIFKQPLKLPKGTKIRSSAWYDNSASNKSNPDASVDVHWGEQTWHEMQFTAITFSVDPVPAPTAGAQQP